MDTLHSISRRLFLKTAPVAAAAVAIPAAPALAAAAVETPAFLAAEAELDAALVACDEAREHKIAARILFEMTEPVVPVELVGDSVSAIFYAATGEVDAEGFPVRRNGGYPLFTVSSGGLNKVLDVHGALIGCPARMHMLKLRRIARKYENAVAIARANAGLDEAIEAYFWACNRLRRAILAVLEAPSTTSAGLVTKARAYSAIAQVPDWGATPLHGQLLADAVLNAFDGVAA